MRTRTAIIGRQGYTTKPSRHQVLRCAVQFRQPGLPGGPPLALCLSEVLGVACTLFRAPVGHAFETPAQLVFKVTHVRVLGTVVPG